MKRRLDNFCSDSGLSWRGYILISSRKLATMLRDVDELLNTASVVENLPGRQKSSGAPVASWLQPLSRLRQRIADAPIGRGMKCGPITFVDPIKFARLHEILRIGSLALVPRRAPGVLKTARRSVLFIHNAYYNYFYLSKALRDRGWDALSASVESPNGPNAAFYHGEDVNLFAPDPEQLHANILAFLGEAAGRFKMIHFYGRGRMSMHPMLFDSFDFPRPPIDFMELKKRGVKIGYSTCGCLDSTAQSSVTAWSGACHRCLHQHDPVVCNDRHNLAWGSKVRSYVDLFASEGMPALDFQSGRNCFREPLTTALDDSFWSPELNVPDRFRLIRQPGEMIVYHSVGNFESRANAERNLKGTGAVISAIDRLKSEGLNVRLEFVTGMRNVDVRFIQVQADIIVDQLNYGRYGATAREGMMLGKPTICHIEKSEPQGGRRLDSIENCPLVSANETTVYEAIKKLCLDASLRRDVGHKSRQYALKWHSASACAARYERVYDAMQDGIAPADVEAA